ncbi:MAG: class I SAM-dependent methyltransferase [Sporolactobacillus sp.]
MTQRYIDFLARLSIDNAHPGGHQLTKQLIDAESLAKGAKLLDVGCGTGATAKFLAEEKKVDVTAIDLHPQMIALATAREKQAKERFTVVRGSAEQLPFPDQSYDWLLSESVTAFTHIDCSLAEYCRVLRKEGILLAIEMTIDYQLPDKDAQAICKLYGVSGLYTEKDWLSHLQKAGFSQVRALQPSVFKATAAVAQGPDYQINGTLDPETIEVWLDHMAMMQTYHDVLSYRVYRAVK